MKWIWLILGMFLLLSAVAVITWVIWKIGEYEAKFEAEYSRIKKALKRTDVTWSKYLTFKEDIDNLSRMRRSNKEKVQVLGDEVVRIFGKEMLGAMTIYLCKDK